MRAFWALLEKELRIYFTSPVAYIVIGLFLAVAGYFFYSIIAWFDRLSMQSLSYAQMYGSQPAINVNMMAIRPFLHNLTIISLLIIPGLTMRLYAEERRLGTFELLQTSPITNWQTALAKFFSALLLYSIALAFTWVYMGMLFAFGRPEFAPVVTGYLGLLLLGGCFIAVGMLCSALTENQLVAFIGAFVANLLLYTIGWVSDLSSSFYGKLAQAIDPMQRFDDFAKGVLDSSYVLFYLSFIFFGIFLTYVIIESARWRGVR